MSADIAPSVRPGGRSSSLPGLTGVAGRVGLMAVSYFAAAKVGADLSSLSGVSAVWPAAGVAVAGLLLLGTDAWVGITVGAFVETISNSISVPVAVVLAAGQTLSPLLAVVLLRGAGFDAALSRLADVLSLTFLGAFASNLVTAVIGPTAFAVGGYLAWGDWPFASFTWLVGDAIGVLVVAPLLLLLFRGGPAFEPVRGRGVEVGALLTVTAVATVVLFGSTLPLVFLVFPFTLWAALRLDLFGAAAVNLLVACVAVWTTIQGVGPFGELPVRSRLVSLQFFNAALAMTGLLLAAVVNERRRALDDVRESRARIVEAADSERRRLERDLHDGAQQRLVSLAYELGLIQARLDEQESSLRLSVGRALTDARAAQSELRSLAHGIHPAVLSHHGLAAAVDSLVEQCPVPVEIHVAPRRYPPVVEATAYFIVSEALANLSKYARASSARVRLEPRHGRLVIEVADDGVGGADRRRGSGLTGLEDRAAALGGQLQVVSPSGGGTLVKAELPCDWS